MTEEFSRGLIDVLQRKLVDDTKKYMDMTQEEYNLIKPPKREQILSLTEQMRQYLFSVGKCSKCTAWMIEASEIKSATSAQRLDVGSWEPSTGIFRKDDIFPHVTGGLRGRKVSVASAHVRLLQIRHFYCPFLIFRHF